MAEYSFSFWLRSPFGQAALRDRRLLAPALSPLKRVLESFGASVDCVVQYGFSSGGQKIYPVVFVVKVAPDRVPGLLEALKSDGLRDIVADVRYEALPDQEFWCDSKASEESARGISENQSPQEAFMELKTIFEKAVHKVVNRTPDLFLFQRGTGVLGALGGLAVGGCLADPLVALFGLAAGAWYGAQTGKNLWLRYRETEPRP